jgi:phosphatidate cytidylyltransferase
MLVRTLSGAAAIPLFVWLCLAGARAFAVATAILAAIGLFEFWRALRRAGREPNPIVCLLGLVAPVSVACACRKAHFGWDCILAGLRVLGMGLVAAGAWEVLRSAREETPGAGSRLGAGLLAAAYISLFAGLSALRTLPQSVQGGALAGRDLGAALVLTVAIAVWSTDTFAYLAGRQFGKRKLAPTISPAKTVEGAIGGLVAGVAAGLAAGLWLFEDWATGLGIGLAAGTLGQIGDLLESALKRQLGTKDFGSLMPGHGGVLDRCDSLIFVATAVAAVLAFR